MDVVKHLRKGFLLQGFFLRGLIQNRFIYCLKIILKGTAVGIAISVLSACNSDQKTSYSLLDNTIKPSLTKNLVSVSNASVHSRYSQHAQQFNNILLAELYSQFDKPELSAKYYHKLLTNYEDPEIARRATILAASSGQLKNALEAVRLWTRLMPDSLEARQYYSLVSLRNNNISESVDQLYLISQFIEHHDETKIDTDSVYSKGLKFIGAMLNIESRHEKALIVFQHYVKKYGTKKNQTQQYLIVSSLAMNAKKYGVVLAALNNVETHELVESSSIILMKVKALQELNKISDAVKILRNFVDTQKPNDGTRLQLVRLLILDHQKKVASPYLKELVKKYPDNNDLLKSLIALEIDQSQLQSAKQNIHKLSKSKEYLSDVAYFRGEIYEAEGDLKSAIKNYQQVVDGNLQKRAKMKLIKLGKGLKVRKVNYKVEQ